MGRRVLVAVLAAFALAVPASTASAQDMVDFTRIDLTPAGVSPFALPALRFADLEQMALPIKFEPVPAPKPSALLASLSASTVVMQALDVHSTLRAFHAGAVEGNPVMSGITGNRVAFVAVKAAVAATTILAVRRIARRSHVAAIITTVAVNSAYAMVVKHNYDIAHGR